MYFQLGGLTFWAKYEKPWKDILHEKYKSEMEKPMEVKNTDELKEKAIDEKQETDQVLVKLKQNKEDISEELETGKSFIEKPNLLLGL